jgi:2-dehydro-3-deoxygluconokinase
MRRGRIVVERLGAGDAFAAGVLFGLWLGAGDRESLGYGLASACLKHFVMGDAALGSAADLSGFLGGGIDVRR